MAVQYLDDGGPDGTVLGKTSSRLVGFFGATPVAKKSATVLGALTAGETTPADVAAALVDLRDQLVTYGLISNT